MATLKFLHIFFFFLVKLGAASSPSSDVKLLLEKVKPSLQGNSENLLLSSWNSVPVCQRRGVKWVFSNVSPLHCSNLSSQYTMEVFDLEVHKGIRSTMEDGLVHALKLAMGCCATASSVIPTMEDFVRQLEENRSTEENIAIVQPE